LLKVFTVFILSLLITITSFGQIIIEASQIEKDSDSVIIAKGNVVITYRNNKIISDEIKFNQKEKVIFFNKKTIFKSQKFYIEALSGWYNINTENGEFFNASIIMENKYFIKAEKISKEKGTFYFESAKFSSCTFEQFDWYIFSTSGSAKMHSFRVFLQVQSWNENNLNPLDFGWELRGGNLFPISYDHAAAPERLLNLIYCQARCKGNSACRCRKANEACNAMPGHCVGLTCTIAFDNGMVHDAD